MRSRALHAKSPTGSLILGTYELCPGRGEIRSFARAPDGSVTSEHAGLHRTLHDGRQTIERNGKTVLRGENGDEWSADQLILVDDGADNTTDA